MTGIQVIYYTQTDGLIECFNGSLKRKLKKLQWKFAQERDLAIPGIQSDGIFIWCVAGMFCKLYKSIEKLLRTAGNQPLHFFK